MSTVLAPAAIDKRGPLYRRSDVEKLVAKDINGVIERKDKTMTKKLDEATDSATEAANRFTKALALLNQKESEFAIASKKASGSVRDSAQKLAEGLTRLEKTANFDRLERLVELLERADKAMTSLASMEKTGRLKQIADALK